MRLQWPRFLTKPEPEVPRTPARPGPLHGPGSLHGQDWCHRNIARRSVPTGFNSTLDTAFTNEVSSLAATPDTRWRARYTIMDPAQVEEDRRSVSAFYKLRPLLFDGTPRTVALSGWLYDLEMIFHLCHVEAHLRVSLASRCLAADARLWWMTTGEGTLPDRTWPHFRTCMINRYGPVPEEGIEEPYRDPEIYRDMQHERYHVFVADWHAYPHEPMDHYCRRFQEAMLPHIPMDIPHPGLQALVILRNGLPPQILQHTPLPTPIMTVAHMVGYILAAEVIAHDMQADAHMVEPEVPDDDAGIPELVYEPEPAYEPDPVYEPEPAYEPGPVDPEDAMPADPVQEAEDDGYDADEDMDAPEDPPIIVISSDDEDDDEEPGFIGWPDKGDDFEEDPEEIPDEDGEADSDVSDVTVVEID
ncbi:hypothetical protein TIFTF001_045522 [Ficus carica]|uniref:Uncharacterized protein n=1 Tax=Ficus carica TaxID=3494 RepID=A0AA87YYT8_FICCA|nr:hypothetical protein TIFTF001_045522 [Ficus carica]